MLEGKRVKRWAPKVFSGCQTCKRRRIKCDETKSKCRRCARSGLECEGYLPPATRIFDPAKKPSGSSQSSEQSQPQLRINASTNSSTPSPAALAVAFTTPEDQQTFEYFKHKTANLISVYSHQPFWKKVLPQASQQHAAVKHSILALAILHQSLTDEGYLSDENHNRLFTHYNTAIRAITKGQPSLDIVLMTCILFWAIENFTGSGRKPYGHVEAAVKILEEFKSNEANQTSPLWEVITEHIEPAIKTAHIHITYNQLEDLTIRHVETVDSYGILSQGLPRFFTTLEAATERMGHCIRCLLRVANDAVADRTQLKSDLAVIQTQLCRWLGLFHTLTVAGPPMQRRMLIVHHVATAMICAALKRRLGEFEDDQVRAKSRALWITHEIEDIMNTSLSIAADVDDAGDGEGSSSRVPSHDLGIIPPLFIVAILCEDIPLKAQALVLLKKLNRVEGQWKSCATAMIAEIIIEMRTNLSPDVSAAEQEEEIRLCDLAFGTDDVGLTLCNLRTGESVDCPIWGMLKDIEEVDVDTLTTVVHNYGYQIEVTS